MAVQNRLAHAEDAPEEDTGLTQVDARCKLCCYSSVLFLFELI